MVAALGGAGLVLGVGAAASAVNFPRYRLTLERVGGGLIVLSLLAAAFNFPLT